MNLLLTGGCGFVGTELTKALLAEGHNVTVVDIMWFGNHLGDHPNLTVIEADIRDTDKVPMSGMDAVSLLENLGIEVEVHGNGKVKNQSVNQGTSIKQVKKIVLELS